MYFFSFQHYEHFTGKNISWFIQPFLLKLILIDLFLQFSTFGHFPFCWLWSALRYSYLRSWDLWRQFWKAHACCLLLVYHKYFESNQINSIFINIPFFFVCLANHFDDGDACLAVWSWNIQCHQIGSGDSSLEWNIQWNIQKLWGEQRALGFYAKRSIKNICLIHLQCAQALLNTPSIWWSVFWNICHLNLEWNQNLKKK